VIGDRSFSADPNVAARLVRAQVCGYHDGGVAAAAKHFPGHGSTRTDSHVSQPTLTQSVSRWRAVDLPPFQRAVTTHVDLVMLGHLAFPALDPSGVPATLSPRLNRRLVRGLLGYEGVVITDALNMGGITSEGSSGSIAVRSVLAGTDLLLMPVDPIASSRALITAVRTGRISRQRIDNSVARILRLKQRLGLFRAAPALARCR
jgi:beta-N-acetylhexosaminidase